MVASRLLPMSAWRQHGSNMAAWQPLRALPDPWRSPPCGMWCGPYHTLGCYPHTPPYHPPRSPGLGSGGILGRGGVGAGVWNPGWGLGSCGSGGVGVGRGDIWRKTCGCFPFVAHGSLAATWQQHGSSTTLTGLTGPVAQLALRNVAWPLPDTGYPSMPPSQVSWGGVWGVLGDVCAVWGM